MFPKERKTNIKLDKLVVKKFPVVAIYTMPSSTVTTANHRVFRYFIYFKCSRLVEAFPFSQLIDWLENILT